MFNSKRGYHGASQIHFTKEHACSCPPILQAYSQYRPRYFYSAESTHQRELFEVLLSGRIFSVCHVPRRHTTENMEESCYVTISATKNPSSLYHADAQPLWNGQLAARTNATTLGINTQYSQLHCSMC